MGRARDPALPRLTAAEQRRAYHRFARRRRYRFALGSQRNGGTVMTDGTDVHERQDEHEAKDDDTDPGIGIVEWMAPPVFSGPARPTPKHKDKGPREPRERTETSGNLLGMFAGFLVVVLIGSNVALWLRSQEGIDTSRVDRVAANQAELVDQLDGLQTSVEDLKGSIASLEQSVANANPAPIAEQVAALQARADALTGCINRYMDELADWTRNIASTFIYTRC
jgi:tetrahydromethanopterin S-methyltransferase subunit B